MDFLELAASHRSVRKYQDRPVPQEALDQILGAALRASSSGNMQVYSIIVTRDPAIKRELYPLHFNQSMVIEAPVMLTFCADFHRMRGWLDQNGAAMNFDNFMSFMIAAIDATLASQNAALAAESLGLGICYMGTTLANCARIAEVLKCPDNVVPVVGFSLGYSAEEIPARDRLPLGGIVHDETYRAYGVGEIREIYRDREEKVFRRYMENPELRERVESQNIKNLAQIYTQLKYTRESHLEYSQTVLKCLQEKNFFNHNT